MLYFICPVEEIVEKNYNQGLIFIKIYPKTANISTRPHLLLVTGVTGDNHPLSENSALSNNKAYHE